MDDDGGDLANSEHLLPDDEEEESIFLASTKPSSQTKCVVLALLLALTLAKRIGEIHALCVH